MNKSPKKKIYRLADWIFKTIQWHAAYEKFTSSVKTVSFNSGMFVMEGENMPESCPLTFTEQSQHAHAHTCVHSYTYTYK